MTSPNLDLETELLKSHDVVIGVDEVGRGALAGPVAACAFFFTSEQLSGMPESLRDSKLVPEAKRAPLALEVASWGIAKVGMSSAAVIDQKGIMAALSDAVLMAVDGHGYENPVILLDGSSNYLTALGIEVVIRTKADRDCGSVAAAAISAKVARDNLLVELSKIYPGFGWEKNKGYASDKHTAAIKELGPTPEHRKTWLTKILQDDLLLF